ncbi:MAG TPA: hypothetical protein ENK02_15415 [Planctomycetes bacterium]|nr:hypothetical protein [Planctomycetota bacterium]
MIQKRIAIVCLLLCSGFPQGNRPSPETLLEKARILAEERGEPKKAVNLLVNKVICRQDLSRSQFDRAARMIASYSGGKPPKEQETQLSPQVPRDLAAGIKKELHAYLSGNGSYKAVIWYGKVAFPILQETLKEEYFRPYYAQKILQLLWDVEPEATIRFLEELRKKGSSSLLRILDRALRSIRPRIQGALYQKWVRELFAWAEISPDPLALLSPSFPNMDGDLFLAFLEKRPKNLPLFKALALYLRDHRPVPMTHSDVFLQQIRDALENKGTALTKLVHPNALVPWLLKQEGGFKLALSLFTHPGLGRVAWAKKTIQSSNLPPAAEGIPLFLEVLEKKPRSIFAWEALANCLEVWEGELPKATPSLQKSLLGLMDRFVKSFSESPRKEIPWGARKIPVRLILGTREADLQFQLRLWEKALLVWRMLEFDLTAPPQAGRFRNPKVVGGPELLLYRWERIDQEVLSKGLGLERRIQFVVRFLISKAMEKDTRTTRTFQSLFNEVPSMGPVYVPMDWRVPFFRALVRNPLLLEENVKRRGTSWFRWLPEEEAKKVFFRLLKNPKVSGYSFRGFFWSQIQKEKNPAAFMRRLLQERPQLDPNFFISEKVEKSYADLLLDWLESRGSSWMNQRGVVHLPALFVSYPSPKAKAFLGKLLLSKVEKARKNAAQVLEDWKRLDELRQEQKNQALRKKLWGIVKGKLPIPARIVALEGLFDLGDKAAWLTLSQWLSSEDRELRGAALEFSRRRKAGR